MVEWKGDTLRIQQIAPSPVMELQKDITISLIIPVYKVAPYIERCMKSVISQTYDHFECILVDDASPDDSIARCERMIADYEGNIQFRILRHEHNRGLSAARNTGMDAATGDYILFIDSDDMISDDCVERLMEPVIADRTVEMVYAAHMKFADNGQMYQPKIYARERAEYKTLREVRDYYFSPGRPFINAAWNKLTSRELIISNGLRFKDGQLWEDAIWTFFEMKHLSHIVFIPTVTYFYFQRPDSITFATGKEQVIIHKNIISDVISCNFTPGEESREAVRYLPDFLFYYVRQPKNREQRAVARRFGKAMPWMEYTKERLLLTAANILPRTDAGLDIFKRLTKSLKIRL